MSDIENVYPLEVILKHAIGGGIVRHSKHKNEILVSEGAIKIVINVNSPDYPKEMVRAAVKEICLKAAQYYD